MFSALSRNQGWPAIETAIRFRQRIAAVYTHAFAAGLAGTNPAAMIDAA